MIESDPERFARKGHVTLDDFFLYNSYRVAKIWLEGQGSL